MTEAQGTALLTAMDVLTDAVGLAVLGVMITAALCAGVLVCVVLAAARGR